MKGLLEKATDAPEQKSTLKFCRVVYCAVNKHEMCVMQLIGKNSFPTYSPYEILSKAHLLRAISPEDAVIITRLDEKSDDGTNNVKF